MHVSMYGPNKRQKLFAKYLVTLGISDSQCYVKAGYSPEGADAGASRLKKNPKVQRLIEQYTADETHKVVATRLERMDRLTEMLRSGSTEQIRIKAIEVLNKMRGDEIHRTEVSGPGGKPLQLQAVVRHDLSKLTKEEALLFEQFVKKTTRVA